MIGSFERLVEWGNDSCCGEVVRGMVEEGLGLGLSVGFIHCEWSCGISVWIVWDRRRRREKYGWSVDVLEREGDGLRYLLYGSR